MNRSEVSNPEIGLMNNGKVAYAYIDGTGWIREPPHGCSLLDPMTRWRRSGLVLDGGMVRDAMVQLSEPGRGMLRFERGNIVGLYEPTVDGMTSLLNAFDPSFLPRVCFIVDDEGPADFFTCVSTCWIGSTPNRDT